MGRTEDELRAMTMRQLRDYAKEIGCCLGYDASRKDTAVSAILSHQRYRRLHAEEAAR